MSKNSQTQDIAFIEALAEVLKKSGLTEIELSRDDGLDRGITVRISRQPIVATVNTPLNSIPNPIQTSQNTGLERETSQDPALETGAVTSPMVGTCFLQSEPETPPFVSIGTKVKEGQTLLIIEAMKTMNHIHASKACVVKRILVEDGSPVEFGAPLMIIE